jgi:hypothetical protein
MPRVFSTLVAAVGFALHAGSYAFAQVLPLRASSPASLKSALPSDMRSEEILGSDGLIGDYLLVIPEPFAPPVPAIDPIYKQRTTRALYVYEGAKGKTPPSGSASWCISIRTTVPRRHTRSAHLIARAYANPPRAVRGVTISFRRGHRRRRCLVLFPGLLPGFVAAWFPPPRPTNPRSGNEPDIGDALSPRRNEISPRTARGGIRIRRAIKWRAYGGTCGSSGSKCTTDALPDGGVFPFRASSNVYARVVRCL